MAQPKLMISLTFAVIAATMWTGSMAQSDCTNVLISMSPCVNYITGSSNRPSSQCCTQLDSVVRSSPQCLCQVLNGGGSLPGGVNVNRTLALQLPRACNVQTPPVSRCNAASPAATPSGTPEAPNTPSETGSRNTPSTEENGTSDGSSINLSISLLVTLLVAASFGSTFDSV